MDLNKKQKKQIEVARKKLATLKQQLAEREEALEADKARLDYLQYGSEDLRCFDIPTGGGDADIGWRLIGHYQAEPRERVIAEVWHDSVRDVIDRARTLTDKGPEQKGSGGGQQ